MTPPPLPDPPQYCSATATTVDHIIPRSKGGGTSWENVVTACQKCNLRKGNRYLRDSGMRLIKEPLRPTAYQLQDVGRSFPPNFLHESWRDYLYWDTELEAN